MNPKLIRKFQMLNELSQSLQLLLTPFGRNMRPDGSLKEPDLASYFGPEANVVQKHEVIVSLVTKKYGK